MKVRIGMMNSPLISVAYDEVRKKWYMYCDDEIVAVAKYISDFYAYYKCREDIAIIALV